MGGSEYPPRSVSWVPQRDSSSGSNRKTGMGSLSTHSPCPPTPQGICSLAPVRQDKVRPARCILGTQRQVIFSIPIHPTAWHGLRQSSYSKSPATHLDNTAHRIPADRRTNTDSTTTTVTAIPGHRPRGSPATNTQPGVSATAWTVRQKCP